MSSRQNPKKTNASIGRAMAESAVRGGVVRNSHSPILSSKKLSVPQVEFLRFVLESIIPDYIIATLPNGKATLKPKLSVSEDSRRFAQTLLKQTESNFALRTPPTYTQDF
jgi:hypothetical protein